MRGTGRIDGARIVVVHYGEHTPMDEGYRPARFGRLAALLQRHGAEVTRYSPTHSRFTNGQRPLAWSGTRSDEGVLRMIPTRSFTSTFGAARFGFFADFARGTAAAISEDGPFDLAVISYPPPGVASAIRRATGGSLPILADIQDLWPDAQAPARVPAALRAFRGVGAVVASELRHTNGVVAMSPVMLARAPRRVRRQVITLGVMETPSNGDRAAAPNPAAPWRAVFVGSLNQLFDFDSMVAGWRRFVDGLDTDEEPPALELYGGGVHSEKVAALVAGVRGAFFGGRLVPDAVLPVLAAADVGLAPIRPDQGTTMSNKVTEYLSVGAFMLHGLVPAIAEELDGAQLGRSVDASPEGWAAAFAWVHRHHRALANSRDARIRLAQERYGESVVEQRWLAEVERLLRIPGSQRQRTPITLGAPFDRG